MTEPSEFVRNAAHRVVGSLAIVGPMSKHDLAANAHVSVETAQHALEWLRWVLGAPIEFDRRGRVWTIGAGWRIPVYELPREELARRSANGDPVLRGPPWLPAKGRDRWVKADRGIEWALAIWRVGRLAQGMVAVLGSESEVFVGPRYGDGTASVVDDATLMAWADWQILVHRAAAIQSLGLEGEGE